MIYKFLLLSDEVDNFAREISIDSEASFLDLQNVILDSVGFTKDQMTSFFICDDDWEKRTEVTLVEMDTDPEFDSWTMEDTRLSELIEEEKQKVLFVFDYITDRSFFMELREIILGEDLAYAECTKKIGTPPEQIMVLDNFEKSVTITDIGENFYGDEEFDPSELDEEGFNDFEASEGNLFQDDKL